MLFHTLDGKVAKFRVNTSYRCYFTYWLEKLKNLELIHYIDAISHIGWKITKFRVNTLYRCYFTYWMEKLQNLELIHHIDAISHIGWKSCKI